MKLLKPTSCQDSPPRIMVMPVKTFVIVQTPEVGIAECRARAAATQCQDVRLHYVCSGVYLIPVAGSADGEMSPESFELVRLITASTQWRHIPNCRSGPDARWDRHLRHRRYGLASCRGDRPQSRHPTPNLKARLRLRQSTLIDGCYYAYTNYKPIHPCRHMAPDALARE